MPPDPLQALLSGEAVPATAFGPTSRYAGVPTAALDRGDGAPPTPYLRRRLCPPPERLALLHQHTVATGDRLDLVAARHLGDPELWWRVADANGAVRPSDLTERTGRRLRIALADGVPGGPDV